MSIYISTSSEDREGPAYSSRLEINGYCIARATGWVEEDSIISLRESWVEVLEGFRSLGIEFPAASLEEIEATIQASLAEIEARRQRYMAGYQARREQALRERGSR